MLYEKHGIFYLLPVLDPDYEILFQEKIVCCLVKTQWRLGKSIFIACENKSQALKIDRSLWNLDKNSFIPHSLFSKFSKRIPIVIYWEQCYFNGILKDLLINLVKKNKDFFFNFSTVIDFVSTQNNLKKLARTRYRLYRDHGFQLTVLDLPTYLNK